jgi:hypothetical protein
MLLPRNGDEEDLKNVAKPLITQPQTKTTTKDAPNIFLNLRPHQGGAGLRIFAAIAVLLQTGVLVFSGCVTYHPQLSYSKAGRKVALYAYPLTASGTLLVVIGMLICSFVVERSTKDEVWRVDQKQVANLNRLRSNREIRAPGESEITDEFGLLDGEQGFRILWLQRGINHSHPVQNFFAQLLWFPK